MRAFWPEAGIRPSKILVAKIEAELERLRRLAGVSHVAFADDWLRG